MKKRDISIIVADIIHTKIVFVRNKRVLLDKDLSDLYGVEKRDLIEVLKRNRRRFPKDFMFKLTNEEVDSLVSQNVISKRGKHPEYYKCHAFTEQGVAMMSGVLRSRRAVSVNIEIMRTFIRFREMIAPHEDLQKKVDQIEKKYDKKFAAVFDAIKDLTKKKDEGNRKVGFQVESNVKRQSKPHGEKMQNSVRDIEKGEGQ
jgi:hypothetical protein